MAALGAVHPLPDPETPTHLVSRAVSISKIPYRVHTRPSLFRILLPRINVVHISTLCLLGSILILSSSLGIEKSTFWFSPRFTFLLIEKLTGARLVEKFPEFDGCRRPIIIFITSHHLSLSRATQIHSTTFHPILPFSVAQVYDKISKSEAVCNTLPNTDVR